MDRTADRRLRRRRRRWPAALPLADTLKQADAAGRVAATVDRSGKWAAQTLQMFRLGLRCAARRQADAVTDESSAIEALGHAPRLVVGDALNFKVTWPGDFALAARPAGRHGNTTLMKESR